jgi:hypothetical protein
VWHEWFDGLPFVGALQRTWVPAGSPRRTALSRSGPQPRPGSSPGDEDVIFAYAVCFGTEDGARAYAYRGATDEVPNGSRETLPQSDGRLTHGFKQDREAATALLRTGDAVVTFTIWSNHPIPVDVLRALASAQADHAASL